MKILVGTPMYSPTEEFLRDSKLFIEKAKQVYDLTVERIWGRSLVDTQNQMAQMLLNGDCTHLLFLEDDHEGHTLAMLHDLILMDTDVAAINYYSRWPAHPKTSMVLSGQPTPHEYIGVRAERGIHDVDLCGFGFTLIKRHVIEALDNPVFRLNGLDYPTQRNVATDRDFCTRTKQLGFKIKANLNHDLGHRGINRDNVLNYIEHWFNERDNHTNVVKRRRDQ